MKHLAIGLLVGCLGCLPANSHAAAPAPLLEGVPAVVGNSQARGAAKRNCDPAGAVDGKAVVGDKPVAATGPNLAERGSGDQDERPRGGGHPTGWRALLPGALR